MAFYSVRVNEEGTEIESPRKQLSTSQSKHNLNETSRSYIKKQLITNDNSANTFKTVRYVNSAAFIEKDIKDENKPNPNEQTEDPTSTSTSDSTEPTEDIDQQYQSHIIMCPTDVPLLELNSNESFPSSNTMSYSYRKVCEVTKIIQKPDAYREWLDAKKNAKYFELNKKQKEQVKQDKEKKERKILAQEKFKQWLVKKSQLKLSIDQKKLEEKTKAKLDENELKCCTFKKTDTQKEDNYRVWLQKKLSKQRLSKEKQMEEERLEKEEEAKKKLQAKVLYEEWLKTAPQKPKPVPLNRGMFTLKGSISKMYINNTPWVPTDEFLEKTKSM